MKPRRAPRISSVSLALFAATLGVAACATDLGVDDLSAPPVTPGRTSVQTKGGVAGEIIIGFKAGASAGDKARARGRANAAAKEAIDSLGGGDLELATIPPGLAFHAAAQALLDDPAVDFAEPNYTVEHMGFPSEDPAQALVDNQLWGVNNSGQLINPDDLNTPTRAVSGTADVDMDLPEAWAQIATTPKTKVYVGIIDEGIDYRHKDLDGIVGNPGEKELTGCFVTDRKGRVTPNVDCCADGKDNDNSGKADDCYGWDFANNDKTVYDGSTTGTIDHHGTHVSGTIAAKPSNAGVTGVAGNVGLISAKFLGANGGTTANAINAVNYLNTLKLRGLNVVASNNSWGGGGFSEGLYNAIKAAGPLGILFVAAAGNETTDTDATPSYPCSYGRDQTGPNTVVKGKVVPGKFFPALANVICVAAHDQDGKMGPAAATYFSNWGKNTVDVSAPGSNILSTTPNNTYAYYRGTSMATPHVTGLVALLASEGVPTSAIKARITGSVVVKTEEFVAGRETRTNGRVNAFRALNAPTELDP